MSDNTYTFTRGIDTVHVTIDATEVTRAKVRLVLLWGALIMVTLVIGAAFLPLLVIPAALTFFAYGKFLTLEQACREKAEAQAIRQFDQMESERWRAMRALK